ncbi:hypothetical protein TWF730_007375 [Orbilia blumenaviensis]|uniref:Uncharacterized protein n=1 Tax=Orbilia blumenaviensis TaxID=1796055 RepID=A0AAV9V7J9_9PEZI
MSVATGSVDSQLTPQCHYATDDNAVLVECYNINGDSTRRSHYFTGYPLYIVNDNTPTGTGNNEPLLSTSVSTLVSITLARATATASPRLTSALATPTSASSANRDSGRFPLATAGLIGASVGVVIFIIGVSFITWRRRRGEKPIGRNRRSDYTSGHLGGTIEGDGQGISENPGGMGGIQESRRQQSNPLLRF